MFNIWLARACSLPASSCGVSKAERSVETVWGVQTVHSSQSDRRGEAQHTMSNMSTTSSTTRSSQTIVQYFILRLRIIYVSVLSPWIWLTTTSSRHRPKHRPGRKPSTDWHPALNWVMSRCWWRRRKTKKKTKRISVDRYRWQYL